MAAAHRTRHHSNFYILQDNGTEFKNAHLISTFESLGIKRTYSNPFYPTGNGKIENVHNFLKRTIAKFLHNSTLEWDGALPLAIYCFNVAPSVNDLDTPFYLVHGRSTGRKIKPSSELLQVHRRTTR